MKRQNPNNSLGARLAHVPFFSPFADIPHLFHHLRVGYTLSVAKIPLVDGHYAIAINPSVECAPGNRTGPSCEGMEIKVGNIVSLIAGPLRSPTYYPE